jgi:3-oxoacyl-[acyl-carrier protein] reductase
MTRGTRREARTQGASICRHIGATEDAASRRVTPVRRPGPFPGQAPNVELGLAGRRALVTGGSKGLGLAIAQELVGEGASVAICARNEEEVLAAGEELRDGEAVVHAQRADVTDPEQVRDFVARSVEALGGVDVLVNNAGRAHPGTFETLTDENWQADLDVKLLSLIRCCREVLPHMRAAGGGRIVNIGAVYGRYPDPTFFATSVNRAAGNAFTKTLALEVARDNILVNGVNIGFVVTPQWDNIHRRRAPDVSREEFFASLAAQEVPLGRFGTPEEVSGLVAFLLSERATYITGASIDVAGGMGKYL